MKFKIRLVVVFDEDRSETVKEIAVSAVGIRIFDRNERRRSPRFFMVSTIPSKNNAAGASDGAWLASTDSVQLTRVGGSGGTVGNAQDLR